MTKRSFVFALCARRLALCAALVATLLLTAAPTAEAQQAEKIPRIGFLQRRIAPTPTSADPLADAFRQGLRELGYLDGKNIRLEHRYAGGDSDRLAELIAELVKAKVDILVIPSGQAIRMAKQATTTIPIVMVTTGDPVASGFVVSLARPGGNITGITRLTADLRGKRLELLKETIPTISRIGILTGSRATIGIEDFETPARGLKMAVQLLEVHGPKPNFDAAFQAAVNGHVNALITTRDAVTASYARRIADLAIKYRLPSMHEDRPYVEAGGLMSYSTDDADSFRRAAIYVDRILKGANPGELPVEQPTKFELVINLKTAKQIGVTIPDSVLFRANRVIR